MIGTRIAHYRIDAVLGSGGMGTVYRAYDLKLERPVALKSVRPQRSQRGLDQFLKEVRTVSNLNDPNIVTIHGFENCDEGRFIVMEFVEGETLRVFSDRKVTRSPLPVEEIVGIAAQMASALRVAHAAGIIHRDIKPENVMVRRNDRLVKLLDFGLARLMPNATSRSVTATRVAAHAPPHHGMTSTRTRRASIVNNTTAKWFGTIQYMSPEQIHGRRLSGAADIFAFGVVLYELLTGTHPFGGTDRVGTIAQILERTPKPPRSLNPDIPEPLARLVVSMLAKSATARPDANTVAEKLSALGRRAIAHTGRPHIVGRQKHLESALGDFEVFPQCVLLSVTGEAGAGKTTFVEEFLNQIAPPDGDQEQAPYLTLRGRCEKLLAGAEAYLPVLEVLHTLLRTDTDGSAAAILKERAPAWYVQVTSGAADAVTDLSGSPQHMNREFFDFLSALRGNRSILLFLDDVHWADVSTVYLLDYLTARADSLRLFTIVTARPESLDDMHPFRDVTRRLATKDLTHELALDQLSPDDVQQYIDLEFPEHRFPQRFIKLIHKRTEGNPLFMVDLLRDLRTRGIVTQRRSSWVVGPLSDIELPKRIESLIDQKVVALNDVDRRLLSWAAVQGYEFDSAMLARVSDAGGTNIEERLDLLERRHALVRRVGNEELPTGTLTVKYRFTHILYQNALEDRVRRTPTRHAELSLAVAHALIAVYGVHRKAVASLLARLFEAAREFSLSAEYFQIAAESAAQISAHHEATTLLTRGLELLQKLPAERQRDERELDMRLALGGSLMALNGFAADGVRQAYGRAKQLCETLGNPEPQIQMVLRGLWGYNLVRAEYSGARELAYSLYSLAQRGNNHALLVEANHALAFTLCHMGDLTTAVMYRREAIKLHAERPGMDYGFPFALDPGVGCGVEYAMDLWMLGYPDQARAEARRARELAERLGHPYSQGFALMFSAVIYEFCGEIERTLELAEQGIRLACEHGLKEVLGWSSLRRGWAIAMAGNFDEGIALQRNVLKRQREMGSEIARPHFLSTLAQCMLQGKRPDAALETIEEAHETIQRTGARYYHAEVLRLRAECALALGEPRAKAEDLFWQAREVARGQDAKSFELRAAISLARLFASSDRSSIGRAGLSEVYSWFKEGYDTEDLREARELLAGLE